MTNNGAQKAILKELYRIVEKSSTKSFHTFRATFIGKCINNFPELVTVVQEIVGHSKGDRDKLTIDIYAKGYKLSLKKKVLDSVSYS
jgi:integrase